VSRKTLQSILLSAALACLCLLPKGLGAGEEANSLSLTARAMGCDLRTVQDIKALNLACSLSWVLMRLCAVSDAKPSQLMDERATRSWGEVCALHGQAWAALVQDVTQRKRTYGLALEASSLRQILRSSSNHPEKLRIPANVQ
jgi:hypothetical protein